MERHISEGTHNDGASIAAEWRAARAYAQAFIDRTGRTDRALAAYADRLAAEYLSFASERTREALAARMQAFIDGYLLGYNEGHGDGYADGRDDGAMIARRAPEA